MSLQQEPRPLSPAEKEAMLSKLKGEYEHPAPDGGDHRVIMVEVADKYPEPDAHPAQSMLRDERIIPEPFKEVTTPIKVREMTDEEAKELCSNGLYEAGIAVPNRTEEFNRAMDNVLPKEIRTAVLESDSPCCRIMTWEPSSDNEDQEQRIEFGLENGAEMRMTMSEFQRRKDLAYMELMRLKNFEEWRDQIIPKEIQSIVFAGHQLVGISQTFEDCDNGIYHLTLRKNPEDPATDYKFTISMKEIEILRAKVNAGQYLDRDQLGTVAESLEENKGEVDKRMQEIIDSTEVNPDAELESKTVEVPIGEDPLQYAIKEDDEGIHIDLDLLESEYPGAQVKEIDFESERVKDAVLDKATGTFNMSDEEAFEFYMLVKQFKANPKMKVKIADLPMSMRTECAKQVTEVGGSVQDYDMFAQLLVQTFVSEVEQNEVFIDIEKELDEALKIPSVMDMFFEHSHQMAHEHIPEMIQRCEEAGDTARADLLKKIGQAIDDAFSMKPLIEYYNNTTRARKAVRRDIDKVKTYINAMNYNNQKTKFKMQDATGMLTAMAKVFIEDAIQKDGAPVYTEEQIVKFVILVCYQCAELDAESIVSATYMYYLMKNVISLTYVEEAKTDFARQLIDNISNVMSAIIDEEAEFYAANPKREGKQKRSKRNKR